MKLVSFSLPPVRGCPILNKADLDGHPVESCTICCVIFSVSWSFNYELRLFGISDKNAVRNYKY